jgi:hypothetical protein
MTRSAHSGGGCAAKRVEHVIYRVRARLSRAGVPGLTREEVSNPVGNTLNHNLIQELLMTTTLVPMDLVPCQADRGRQSGRRILDPMAKCRLGWACLLRQRM